MHMRFFATKFTIFMMHYPLCFLFLFAATCAQRLIYLNTSTCISDVNATCFSNNVNTHYLALDLVLTSTSSQQVPTFTLASNEIVEILWQLPPVSLRFLGISTTVNTLSDGIQVFAEVSEPWDQIQMATQCQLSSPELLWGSIIRLLLSPSANVNHVTDEICTLILPVPGRPYTNTTETTLCQNRDNSSLPTTFSVIMRLTLPENATKLDTYIQDLPSKSKVSLQIKETTCEAPVFGYPVGELRPNVTGESYDSASVRTLKVLIDQVVESILLAQPHADIRGSETLPWILDGFTCINQSINCQGSTNKSTYEHSIIFNMSKNSSLVVVGAVHSSFLETAFYSSMTFYKLMNQSDRNSGAAIAALVDSDQKGSATGFVQGINVINFFVAQFAYDCLSLPSSAICQTFTLEQVQPGNSVFVASRVYATPAGPLPESLLHDVVLFVQY